MTYPSLSQQKILSASIHVVQYDEILPHVADDMASTWLPFWREILKSKAFTRYLLLTNVVSGVVVDASGDFFEQRVIERTSPHDWERTARMATVGVTLTVPDHYWYRFLDRRLPGRSPKTITLKVALDFIIMGPVNIVLFYLGMCKLEGHSWRESFKELKDKFMTTLALEFAVWPAAQALNFYYVPPPLRLMYLNGVYFIWSVVLSHLKHYLSVDTRK